MPLNNRIQFARNFGGRASATRYASVIGLTSAGRVFFTVSKPSEFRMREDGTLTVYSRTHKSTSVYGERTAHRSFVGITHDGKVENLTF